MSIKLKLLGYVVVDFELTKRHSVHTNTITTITATRDIEVKLSGSVLGKFQLNQNKLYPCSFSKGHIINGLGTA